MNAEGFAFAVWLRHTYPQLSVQCSRDFNSVALDIWRDYPKARP